MSVEYSYEIVSVDEQARVMEVVYTSPGRQTMHVGARLPYQGESVEGIIHMYSPVRYWEEQATAVVVPQVGETGSVVPPSPPPVTLESVKAAKLAQIADWRYSREIRGVSLDGVLIKTDRESQATINGAYSSIKDGLLAGVDWKAADGNFVTLGLPEITAIDQAVAAHVQDCFTKEKTLSQQVGNAVTIAEVEAIDPYAIFPDQFGTIPSSEV